MAFGLSFGKKSAKQSSTTNINKTETGFESGFENTLGSKTGTQSTTGTTSNTGTGTSSTTGSTNQATNTAGSTTTTGKTTTLNENVRGGVEGAIQGLLYNIFNPESGDRAMLTRGMDSMGDFDVDSYVNGTLQAAKAQQGTQLDEILGSLFSRVGGAEGNNSASTLLAARAKNDAASNLAGIEATARATGAKIQEGQLSTMAGVLAGQSEMLPALLGIAKGAETTTDQSQLLSQIENVVGKTAGTTATAENSTQTQNVHSVSTEALIQQIAKALSQTSNTVGTETSKGKSSQTGGGASLSF